MNFPVRFPYVIYFIIVLGLLQFALPNPFTWIHWIIAIATLLVCYFVIDWIQFYGWKKIGKINFTFVFNDEEIKRKFVVYTTNNENNVKSVVQHISASIKPEVLMQCIGEDVPPVEVVNPDGSTINVHNCGNVLSVQLTQMADLFKWANKTLHIGIVNEERNRVNEGELIMTSYLLLDAEDSSTTMVNRNIETFKVKYIFGQSDETKVSLKIKKRTYSDVSIYMHIFDDSVAPHYENFLAFGILGENKLVENKRISSGDEVYLKIFDR